MKTALIVFIFVLFFPLSGQMRELEPLLGFNYDSDENTLKIEVYSSGCTGKKDFLFELKEGILSIYRIRRDDCKAIPMKISLTYSYGELGVAFHGFFKIANPFLAGEDLPFGGGNG